MKLWIKYLVGIILGIAASFIIPWNFPVVNSVLTIASEFAFRFGRYTLLPLLVFGVASSFFKLRSDKKIVKTTFWTLSVIIGSTLILLLIGIVSVVLIKLPRIPITSEKISEVPNIDIKNLILQLLPLSSFDALKDGVYLLPAFIFAALAGAGCASDQISSKPMINLIESASKLCYTIASFFIEWISVAMIAICCHWMIQARNQIFSSTFAPLFLMLLVDFIIVSCLIYPLILHFLCRDPRPFHVLYASLCPILAGFFSADTNLALQVNMRHGKESLGIHDPVNNFSFPLFAIFARGGTVLVTSICLITILRSYSSLGFTFSDITWLFFTSFGLSFVLGGIPNGGAFVTLTILCSIYGRSFEAGFLLLRPAAPILCSFATAFDVLSAMTGSYIVAVKTKMFEHIELKHYI